MWGGVFKSLFLYIRGEKKKKKKKQKIEKIKIFSVL
jgi:hypothetical protein